MSGKMKKFLAGLVVFVSGVVVGTFGMRVLAERGTLAVLHGDPERFVDMALHHLTVDLDLTSDQVGKIRPIMTETAKKLAAIRREQEPKIQEALDKDVASIKAVLEPGQVKKFEGPMLPVPQETTARDNRCNLAQPPARQMPTAAPHGDPPGPAAWKGLLPPPRRAVPPSGRGPGRANLRMPFFARSDAFCLGQRRTRAGFFAF